MFVLNKLVLITDVCFFRQLGGGFSAHANETINTRLLTLTSGIAFSLGSPVTPGVSLAQPGMHGPMKAREKH